MTRPFLTRTAAVLALTALAACSSTTSDINQAPGLTPVGAGLTTAHAALPVSTSPAEGPRAYHSLWNSQRDNLFADSRAMRVGDVLTVRIAIDDEASLDNQTSRSRDSGAGFGLGFAFGVDGAGTSGDFGADLSANSRSRGRGSVGRSERVVVSVAAVVTQVLPNGNLLISGSQEVRVNYEVRVISVAGIVRPRDISPRNIVLADQIAEARISYGGAGRSTEVQQPGWGQQLYDRVSPF
ncbi:flagellar basal body L-ring protein FlgH [Salinarimonas ramus]|uniref:Flagellar L-ring protein n=1 Tax=Salinarimonas ramus TaxID=690164 RepID=A0A917QCW3_9HYPH|nr:flagellar basal body L-ring protein FlgH [Salinarimonas ramus]GGK41716.1 flagellar L-ring protein 2 [Salinarimonas ramus]